MPFVLTEFPCEQLADDMIPPWLLKQILIGMSYILPKGKLVPQKDLADIAFKDLNKRKLVGFWFLAFCSLKFLVLISRPHDKY